MLGLKIFLICLFLGTVLIIFYLSRQEGFRARDMVYQSPRCDSKDGLKYSCPRHDLNRSLVSIKRRITDLRELEYSDVDISSTYNRALPIMSELLQEMLSDREKIVLYEPFLRELYERSVYYYPVINDDHAIGKVKVVSCVKHNQCFVELVRLGLKAPLLHFDTHSDMRSFQHHDVISTGTMEPGNEFQTAFEIGSFSSYYLSFSKKPFVWVAPSWVDDAQDLEKNTYNITAKGDVKYLEKGDSNATESFTKGGIESANWGALIGGLGGEDYIMSVDLDFFVTNGSSTDRGDYRSSGRVLLEAEFGSPYDDYSGSHDSHEIVTYKKKRLAELDLIKDRVSRFEAFLRRVSESGIYPRVIVISDSCNVLFSRNEGVLSVTNNFCPAYLALYLRRLVFEALSRVFGGDDTKVSQFG